MYLRVSSKKSFFETQTLKRNLEARPINIITIVIAAHIVRFLNALLDMFADIIEELTF
jgi:hypothetical protein